jgi:hypothetical protein
MIRGPNFSVFGPYNQQTPTPPIILYLGQLKDVTIFKDGSGREVKEMALMERDPNAEPETTDTEGDDPNTGATPGPQTPA